MREGNSPWGRCSDGLRCGCGLAERDLIAALDSSVFSPSAGSTHAHTETHILFVYFDSDSEQGVWITGHD